MTRERKADLIAEIIFIMLALLFLGFVANKIWEHKEQQDPEQKNYVIILNDDQEAMPAVGGYLKVEKFKGDTVYVGTVE